MNTSHLVLALLPLLFLFAPGPDTLAAGQPSSGEVIVVTDFFPAGYVKDGSVGYQKHIQRALDTAVGARRTVIFPPMIYRVNESGLRLHSKLTLMMQGAVFRLPDECETDGQVFFGQRLEDVELVGGEIAGSGKWPEGVNVRGIHITGRSRNIRIRDMFIHDISSNGIGLFGSAEQPIRDVWVEDVVIERGCNDYGDYLSSRVGPEPGSDRKDQGLIAFYYVEDFVVRGCRLEKSRSDGTHFYRCRRGQIVANKIYGAKMGGFFLETCEDVLSSANIMRDNGSRGATIERGSKNCIFIGNTVANSGREGLWAPNCSGLIVTGNIFDRNGRKPNGKAPNQMWNANITINSARHDPTKSATVDYVIAENIIYTSAGQVAAIRVDAEKVSGIVIENNLLRGENQRILVQGEAKDRVLLRANEGAVR